MHCYLYLIWQRFDWKGKHPNPTSLNNDIYSLKSPLGCKTSMSLSFIRRFKQNNLEVLNSNCTMALGIEKHANNSPHGWVQRFPEKVSMVICVQTLKTHSNNSSNGIGQCINTCYHGTPWNIDNGHNNKRKNIIEHWSDSAIWAMQKKKNLLRSRLNLNLPIGFHPIAKKNTFFEGWWWFHHPTPVNEHSWRGKIPPFGFGIFSGFRWRFSWSLSPGLEHRLYGCSILGICDLPPPPPSRRASLLHRKSQSSFCLFEGSKLGEF